MLAVKERLAKGTDELHKRAAALEAGAPRANRARLLEQAFKDMKDEPSARDFIVPDVILEGELCHKCRRIFTALMSVNHGDYLKVLRHVQVERFYISRRYQTGTMTVEPQMSVDAQGNIAVIWYDTRRDLSGHLLDVYGTISTDGGHTFSANNRITSTNFNADAGVFTDARNTSNFYFGDRIGLALANGTVYAAWTGTSTGNLQDVFFTTYDMAPAPAPFADRFESNNTAQTATAPPTGRDK